MIPFARMLKYGNNIVPVPEYDRSMQSQYNSVFYLHRNGDLYSYGNNNLGQLGVGDATTRSSWTKVLTSVSKYWLGVHGCLAVKTDGSLWYTGSSNAFPQLGAGTYVFINVDSYFAGVGIDSAMIRDVMITDSIKVLTTDGRFLYCGANGSRQLGTGGTSTVNTLTFNTTLTNIVSMSGNFQSTVLVLSNGEAWQAGTYQNSTGGSTNRNPFGKVLDGVNFSAGSYQSQYYFMNDYTVRSTGLNSNGQCSVGNTNNVPETAVSNFTYSASDTISVYSSLSNTVGTSPVIKKNGTLYRCGNNSSGQVGINSTTPSLVTSMTSPVMTNVPSIKYFCADNNRYFIIDNEYKLYTCGAPALNGVGNYAIFTYAGEQPWN